MTRRTGVSLPGGGRRDERPSPGEEIARLGSGDIMGEGGIVRHSLRSASLVALTPLELIHFTAEAVEQPSAEMPGFQQALEAVAASRLG